MEVNQNILTTSNLNLDLNAILHESKEIHYTLNATFSSYGNSEYDFFIQNVNSNKLCVDFGSEVLGAIKLDKNNFAIFIQDSIILFDADLCTKVVLVVDSCLNFGKKVKGVYKYNRDGRTIYFIDEKNSLRVYNIDKVYPKKKVEKDCNECIDEYTNRLDCDSLLVWKKVKFPNIKFDKGNGRLPSGKYQIGIAFTQDKLRLTDYFIYPEIFTVSPFEKSSLSVDFECFNEYFEEYELVLITNREDRGTIAQRIAYLDTSITNYNISEVDSANYTPIDTKVLLSKKPYYQKFDHIEHTNDTTNGYLILGGLEERKPLNYWKQSFNIDSEWVSVRVPAKDAYKVPSYLRDEVYAHTIAWIYPDGQISEETHIRPKVALKPEWDVEVDNNDTWTDCKEVKKKYWEIYNTAEVKNCTIVTKIKLVNVCDYTLTVSTGRVEIQYTDISGLIYRDFIDSTYTTTAQAGTFSTFGFYEDTVFEVVESNCRIENLTYQEEVCVEQDFDLDNFEVCEYKVSKKGNFAYWESELTYPSHENFNLDKNDLRCKGINHFKFPDNKISPHHELIDGKEYINVLGIQFSNIEKPKDCDGNYIPVIGYVINTIDRSNHKSILHKGLISNMWEEELSDCSTSYYNNYPFNDLNPDVFLSKTKTHGDIRNSFKPVTKYSRNRFTYTSPDVDYIRNSTGEEIRLYSEEHGKVSGLYQSTKEFPEIKFLSDSFYTTLGTSVTGLWGLQLLLSAQAIGSGFNGGGGTTSILLLFESMYNIMRGFLPYDNYGINYLAYGNYNNSNSNNIQIGNTRRRLDYSNYLLPTRQIQDNDKINNNQREQGLYLKLNRDILDPSIKEYSRVRAKDANCNDFGDKFVFNPATNQNEYATCSSYYVGIKVSKPSQYGALNNGISIKKYFNNEVKTINSTPVIFGGDVYITKHKKLRKFPFFTQMPASGTNDLGVIQSSTFNVWKPRFWMDYENKNPISGSIRNFPIIRDVVDYYDKSPFNFEYGNQFDKKNCDDDLNCRRPTTGDSGQVGGRTFRNDGSIYTHVIGIQEYWCESEFISDFRESNEVIESNLNLNQSDLVTYNRITNPELSLYNLQYLFKGVVSNLLKAKPNVSCCCDTNTDQTRIIFSQSNSLESQGDKWQSFLSNNYHQFTNTYGKMIGIHRVNDGNIMFVFEDATYVTQNNAGILTDKGLAYLGEGDIFARQMLKLPGSQNLESFVNTPYGVYWCNAKLKEFYFYNESINNITDGIRSWSYEFIKESDIKGIYDNYTQNVYWSSDKWTISYKPAAKTWVSFHSFIPDSYLSLDNNFLTVKGGGIWKHNDKYNYQNYYGKDYPFIVGFTVNNKFQSKNLNSIELYADFIKEHGYNSKEYTNKFFSNIAVFTERTSTGLQELIPNGQQTNNTNPKYTKLHEGKYRINGFRNIADSQPITSFENMTYSYLNTKPTNLGAICGNYNKVHFHNNENLKVLVKLNLSIETDNIK